MAVSYFLIPYVLNHAELNRSVAEPLFKYDSYGHGRVLKMLVTGQLLDAGRWPVLTVLLAVGIVVAARRRAPWDRALLALLATWLLLFFGRPTLEQNVETLYWIRDIVEKGAAWFTSHGRRERKGLRSFSVSGRVKKPGVVLAPAGITVRELIEEYCGGMQEGHRFKAYLPGGASGGILPATMADLPLDFGTLEQYGCFVGSHAVVVLSDKDDMKAVALNLMRFFEDESCGQCTPCRIGTEKAVKLMATGPWDKALLTELSDAMRDASICGLGQAAPNPLTSVFRYFPEELEKPLGTW